MQLPKHKRHQSSESARLSDRETEVLTIVAQGYTSREAAEQLFVAKCTIDYHLEKIYRKLGVNNRLNAVRQAIRHGILPSIPNFTRSRSKK